MSDSDSTVPAGFRVIPGFPRYAINEYGIVLSSCVRGGGWRQPVSWKDAKRMTFTKDKNGYHKVALSNSGKEQQVPVHSLVLLAFVGPRPDGMVCRHLDGNKHNNHISNLSWGTAQQNSDDMVLHGTLRKGESVHLSKLTEKDVLEIRERAASGEKLADIAKDFPVVASGIFKIVRRETWKHI